MSSQQVAVNRHARYEYFIFDQFEAGIALSGSEVKSIREGKVNLKDAFVRIIGGEVYVVGMHISPYSHTENVAALDPTRSRKLLLRRGEIDQLAGLISRKGYTCVPLSIYFKHGVAKLQVGVGQGKKQHDKRQTLKKKMYDREMRQALKRRSK